MIIYWPFSKANIHKAKYFNSKTNTYDENKIKSAYNPPPVPIKYTAGSHLFLRKDKLENATHNTYVQINYLMNQQEPEKYIHAIFALPYNISKCKPNNDCILKLSETVQHSQPYKI